MSAPGCRRSCVALRIQLVGNLHLAHPREAHLEHGFDRLGVAVQAKWTLMQRLISVNPVRIAMPRPPIMVLSLVELAAPTTRPLRLFVALGVSLCEEERQHGEVLDPIVSLNKEEPTC